MFSYYGSKKRIAHLYPKPVHEVIIEPFAGAAAYSCLYPEREVHLYDVDPRIIGAWNYLIQATKDDVMALPLVKPGQMLTHFDLTAGEFTFLGYMISASTRNPKITATEKSNWNEGSRARIAMAVGGIKHWSAICLDFRKIPDPGKCTWFIDPPYEDKGKWYDNRLTGPDYMNLANFIVSEWKGQRIACESTSATWLPFTPLTTVGGQSNNLTQEGLWYEEA